MIIKMHLALQAIIGMPNGNKENKDKMKTSISKEEEKAPANGKRIGSSTN